MPNPPQLQDFIPENFTVSNPDKKLHHVFNEEDCYALWAAYSAGRPLLIRGKPGTGKSQMARAIAEQLGWAFVSEVIRGSTELSDLHWHFDAIGRLGEAQAMSSKSAFHLTQDRPDRFYKPVRSNAGPFVPPKFGCRNKPDNDQQDLLNPLRFLSPGAFWWAYDWETAEQQYEACSTRLRPKPEALTAANADNAHSGGVVLLLDEIDKAEPDLPNGLLETLGHYQFTVPYISHQDKTATIKNPVTADPARLLIVITTNEERELPTAFVRRCFVHTLKMEESPELVNGIEKRHRWLIERGKLHFAEQIAAEVYQQAAELLWQDRAASSHTRYPPGLAEYIDLLNSLQGLNQDEQKQRLDKIARYALKKELDE